MRLGFSAVAALINAFIEKTLSLKLNCTPFVRQYDILDNKWGASLCQKEYQTNDTRQNLRN